MNLLRILINLYIKRLNNIQCIGKLFDVQLIENQLNACYEKTATIAIVSVAGLWSA